MSEARSGDSVALAEWAELSEALMRGIVHAFNNRITALSAFAELAAMGDEEFRLEHILPAELVRLQGLNAHLRLLISEEPVTEALELGPVVDDALALQAHHPRLRAVRCEVLRDGPLLPVRAPRWALLRLLLALMETGRRSAEQAGREATVLRVTADGEALTFHVDGRECSPYALMMARICGATVDVETVNAVVRLPSLLEVRRRDRERREAASRS